MGGLDPRWIIVVQAVLAAMLSLTAHIESPWQGGRWPQPPLRPLPSTGC
jgi:hypothetical protein